MTIPVKMGDSAVQLTLEITPRVRRELGRLVRLTPLIVGWRVEFMALVVGRAIAPEQARFRAGCVLLCKNQIVSPASVVCTGIRETLSEVDDQLGREYLVIGVLHHHPFTRGLFHSVTDDTLLYADMVEQFAVENRIPWRRDPAGNPGDAESVGVGFSVVVDLQCDLYAEAALLRTWPSTGGSGAVEAVPVDLVEVEDDEDPNGLPPEKIAPAVARALRERLTTSWGQLAVPVARLSDDTGIAAGNGRNADVDS